MDIFEAARKNQTDDLATALNVYHPDQADSNGNTALTLACYYNNKEAVNLLLSANANPDLKDRSGNTALMGACFKGYKEIALLLLDSGASVDKQNGNGATALTFAATFGKHDVVQLLLDRGAQPLIRDKFGKNPVDYAKLQENELCYELLAAAANLTLLKKEN